MHATTQHVILYADDDHDDQQLIAQAFEHFDATIKVHPVANGEEALDYLLRLSPEDQHPCLIILDINMPKMDGKEALMKIRQSEALHKPPVVLFSTSTSPKDKDFAAKWNAAFISKPLTFTDLVTIAEAFVKHCDFEIAQKRTLEKAS